MSRRDFRCMLSGVSLLDSEVALILVQEVSGQMRPAALPLWGRYEGLGSAAEIGDGPNADLILGGFQQALSAGTLTIDFEQMGLVPQEIDHIETLLGVIACAQLSGGGAVRTPEGPIGFALIAAHMAAVGMDGDPQMEEETQVEDLPALIFATEFARSLYGPLRSLPVKLRCKFGLSLAGLLSLDQELRALGVSWSTPGPGIAEEDARPLLWRAEAMVKFGEHEAYVEALEDYATQEADDEVLQA